MPPSGNFGGASLKGGQLIAIGNAVEESGFDSVSLHIAIVQGETIVRGAAEVSGGNWTTNPPLLAGKLSPGPALGLASQTLVAEGAPPTFLTLTWAEELDITAQGT
jgi:hypothetical protein